MATQMCLGSAPAAQPGLIRALVALEDVRRWIYSGSCEDRGRHPGFGSGCAAGTGLKVSPVERPRVGQSSGAAEFSDGPEASWVEEGSVFKAVLWGVGISCRCICSGSLGP